MKKRWISSLLAGLLAVSLTACGGGGAQQSGGGQTAASGSESSSGSAQAEPTTLKVGATAVPHAEILNEVVKPALEKEGINLEVIVFQDYVLPNTNLADGELDANYFQHIPWLENTNKEKGLDLTYVAGVHI